MGSVLEPFNYSSLKESLEESTAEVLLPSDGEEYEKSIARWSESCTKRAVSLESPFPSLVYSTVHLVISPFSEMDTYCV